MEELTAQFLVVHESDDGLQWESLQAAAAGQQIWVLVGPGLAVCREEAGGERWGGARLGVSKGSKVERGNPEVRGEGWGGQAVPGPSPGERHPPEGPGARRSEGWGPQTGSGAERHQQRVPVQAGARAGDARRAPEQRGIHPRVPMRTGPKTGDSPEGSGLSGIHGAHGLRAPRGRGSVPRRRSVPRNLGMDTSFGDQSPRAKAPASCSGFTSMTSSGVSMSSPSGSGSTRRGTQPALRRDMGRWRRSRQPARRPDAQVSGLRRPAPNFLHVLVLPWLRPLGAGSCEASRCGQTRPPGPLPRDECANCAPGVDFTRGSGKKCSQTHHSAGDT